MLEVGKLYTCEKYCLMLYPDPETADVRSALEAGGRSALDAAAASAAYWSKRFGKPISYAEKNIPLLVLNNEEKYVEVLAGDKKGWIIDQDWLEIKEIDNV